MTASPQPLAPRGEVLVAQKAMIGQAAIGLIMMTTLTLLTTKSIWEKASKLRIRTKRGDRTLIWIFFICLISIIFYILEMLQYAMDWTGKNSECALTCTPFIPLTYVLTKQFLYFFLYERAAIVHDSLKLRQRSFLIFRAGVAFAIVIGIPAAFYWSFFIVFSAQVFIPEGVCVMVAVTSGPVIAFAVLDLVLSAMLLVLFAYPLWKHLKQISSDHDIGHDKLYKLMKRNMLLSWIITSSTFLNLLAMV